MEFSSRSFHGTTHLDTPCSPLETSAASNSSATLQNRYTPKKLLFACDCRCVECRVFVYPSAIAPTNLRSTPWIDGFMSSQPAFKKVLSCCALFPFLYFLFLSLYFLFVVKNISMLCCILNICSYIIIPPEVSLLLRFNRGKINTYPSFREENRF